MMSATSHILLVEGKSDEAFYNEVFKKINIKASVKVAPPRSLGGQANNKEGVFSLLPALLKQLTDGSLSRLAVVVDADFVAAHGLGFARTLERLTAILRGFGFDAVQRPGVSGFLFTHAEGFHDVGVWIMPNNRDDGMLEDWIKLSLDPAEQNLFTQAVNSCAALKAPKFKPIHKIKANVATWLSWQAAPGRGMEYSIQENLVDWTSPSGQHLVSWLVHVFS